MAATPPAYDETAPGGDTPQGDRSAAPALAPEVGGTPTREHHDGLTAPLRVVRHREREFAGNLAAEIRSDNVSLLAAGVACYWMIALVPALAALVSLYGLFVDPERIDRQVRDATQAVPPEVQDLLVSQLSNIAETSSGGLGLTAALGFLIALWSASAGVKHLMAAINAAYDQEESRNFAELRLLAVGLTFGMLVVGAVSLAALTVLPGIVERTVGLGGRDVVTFVRWPVLAVLVLGALSVFYRVAPDREGGGWRWSIWGAVAATVLWLAASGLFSLYAQNFGTYNETYGTLGAVVVVLLWLLLSAYAVIFGAEVNAEIERESSVPGTLMG